MNFFTLVSFASNPVLVQESSFAQMEADAMFVETIPTVDISKDATQTLVVTMSFHLDDVMEQLSLMEGSENSSLTVPSEALASKTLQSGHFGAVSFIDKKNMKEVPVPEVMKQYSAEKSKNIFEEYLQIEGSVRILQDVNSESSDIDAATFALTQSGLSTVVDRVHQGEVSAFDLLPSLARRHGCDFFTVWDAERQMILIQTEVKLARDAATVHDIRQIEILPRHNAITDSPQSAVRKTMSGSASAVSMDGSIIDIMPRHVIDYFTGPLCPGQCEEGKQQGVRWVVVHIGEQNHAQNWMSEQTKAPARKELRSGSDPSFLTMVGHRSPVVHATSAA
jgi:hypothetical protein